MEEVNWLGQDFAYVVVGWRFVHIYAPTHQFYSSPWLLFTVTLAASTSSGLISWASVASDGCSTQLEFKCGICGLWAGGWIVRSKTDDVIFWVLVVPENEAKSTVALWYLLTVTLPSPASLLHCVWILYPLRVMIPIPWGPAGLKQSQCAEKGIFKLAFKILKSKRKAWKKQNPKSK